MRLGPGRHRPLIYNHLTASSHGMVAGSVVLHSEVEGGLGGVGGADLPVDCFPT